jgi:hypothetical protein
MENSKLERGASMTLNTITNTRKTLARLIRRFNKSKITESKFRALVYAISQYKDLFLKEVEITDIQRDYERIKEALEIDADEVQNYRRKG